MSKVADRWEAFTDAELTVLDGALVDSGSHRSDFAWYKQCANLDVEIVDERRRRGNTTSTSESD